LQFILKIKDEVKKQIALFKKILDSEKKINLDIIEKIRQLDANFFQAYFAFDWTMTENWIKDLQERDKEQYHLFLEQITPTEKSFILEEKESLGNIV
jgi:hypothetical protein